MAEALQCPHCVLRFSTQSELEQHKALDHPDTVEGAPSEESAPPAPQTEPPARAEPEPEPDRKGGFFKRLLGGG